MKDVLIDSLFNKVVELKDQITKVRNNTQLIRKVDDIERQMKILQKRVRQLEENEDE